MSPPLRFVTLCIPLFLCACSAEQADNGTPSGSDGGQDPELDGSPPDRPSDHPLPDSPAKDTAPSPFVTILFPSDGQEVLNPVTFRFSAGGGVSTVWFEADNYPLQPSAINASVGELTYNFNGVNTPRHIIAQGRSAAGATIATDEITFTPVSCRVADQPGFNHYTVAAINNKAVYPKDGSQPYCWSGQGDTCNGKWGMVHDGAYAGETIFPGGGDCFCSGHTLEIFLRAYQLWQTEHNVAASVVYQVGQSQLLVGDVDPYGSNGGEFYQYWQGFGVTNEASSADAFATFGIGKQWSQAEWDEALPGDYVNLSRSTGSGHAVIFVAWIVEGGERIGLRYYGCNGSGDSCPDPDDPANTTGNSGPSFRTELFEGHGGTVLPNYLFIGRAFEPTGG